jgi:hypothetical protein
MTHQNAVVELRAALLVVKDAAHIKLERPLVGLDCDRDGLLGGGLLEGDLGGFFDDEDDWVFGGGWCDCWCWWLGEFAGWVCGLGCEYRLVCEWVLFVCRLGGWVRLTPRPPTPPNKQPAQPPKIPPAPPTNTASQTRSHQTHQPTSPPRPLSARPHGRRW